MKGSTRAATALAVGYVLGRRRKLRAAAVMAAATAVGGTTVGGMVMRRGMKLLGSSDALGKVAPQLGDIVDAVRGDLLPAGKAAVASAASGRLDAVTDSLHERAERVRNPVGAAAEGAEGAGRAAADAGGRAASAGGRAASAAGGAARRVVGRRRRAEDAEDEYRADDEAEDYEAEEPEYDEAEDDADQDDYPEDDADADADAEREEPAGRGRRTGNDRGGNGRTGGTTRRSPVTRTGR